MSDPFYKFLGSEGGYKSYAHASGLYLDGGLAKTPKLGFMYFVSFTLNEGAVLDSQWYDRYQRDLGFLVKKVELPKFKITTETLNQYNRKTNIQTKVSYDPVTFEFHDDNSQITNGLWKNYYKYYYADSNYTSEGVFGPQFDDTKYGTTHNRYGLDNNQTMPFFKSIDIFVMHQGNFTQISLSNPLISQWDHDTLEQSVGTKVLQNRMTVVFDNVAYYQGRIEADDQASMYRAEFYDELPGSIGEGISNIMPTPAGITGLRPEPAPEPIPRYASPMAAYTLSTRDQQAMRAPPAYPTPKVIGAGTFGLSSYRPPSLLGGISLWYGYGGLHGTGVVNAGPVRLIFKK